MTEVSPPAADVRLLSQLDVIDTLRMSRTEIWTGSTETIEPIPIRISRNRSMSAACCAGAATKFRRSSNT